LKFNDSLIKQLRKKNKPELVSKYGPSAKEREGIFLKR